MVTNAPQLPTANVRKAGDFPEDQFLTLLNVPVFAEHETLAKDGRALRFTRRELMAVAERCNRRIRETGDYAAISLGHTSEDEAAAAPPVIGYAGPFRVGVLGQPGAKARYAILADFHVFKDQAAKLREFPRRSPELWVEDRY